MISQFAIFRQCLWWVGFEAEAEVNAELKEATYELKKLTLEEVANGVEKK
jgi:hypothetical protein